MATVTSQITKQNVHVIWLNQSIDKLKRDFAQQFTHLQTIVTLTDTYPDDRSFLNRFFEIVDEKVVLISNGGLAEKVVPVIHDALVLDSVFIFCLDTAKHEQWAKTFTKVKGVFSKIETMFQSVVQHVQRPQIIFSKPELFLTVPGPLRDRSRTPSPSPSPSATRGAADTLVDSKQDKPRRRSYRARISSPSQEASESDRTASKPSATHSTDLKSPTSSTPAMKDSSESQAITTSERKKIPKPSTDKSVHEVALHVDQKLNRMDAEFRRKRLDVVSNKRFRDAVKQWSAVSSIRDLVDKIQTQGTNSLERAWLLFCWIAGNIEYQVNCNNNAAETVFRTRKGVCRGFVSLYHECCTLLDIDCDEISGYVRQAYVKSVEDLRKWPHAWNSIVLDKYTYLVDPTWGASSKSSDNMVEDYYFLTPPDEFIYTHYCNGNQLLEPEISKTEFLSLPVMKTTYYRLGLTLLSPKQGSNEISDNLFKIAIRKPENVDLFIQLNVGEFEYPRPLHTLCQRDATESDVYNCYIAPPLDGLYEVCVFGKTNREKSYYDVIYMRLRVSNIANAFAFPIVYSSFTEHNCILVEPLSRFVRSDEEVVIHMIIPNANVIKIKNGDDTMAPSKGEYTAGVLKKRMRVQGDLQICARWDDKADSISVLCGFHMI